MLMAIRLNVKLFLAPQFLKVTGTGALQQPTLPISFLNISGGRKGIVVSTEKSEKAKGFEPPTSYAQSHWCLFSQPSSQYLRLRFSSQMDRYQLRGVLAEIVFMQAHQIQN